MQGKYYIGNQTQALQFEPRPAQRPTDESTAKLGSTMSPKNLVNRAASKQRSYQKNGTCNTRPPYNKGTLGLCERAEQRES